MSCLQGLFIIFGLFAVVLSIAKFFDNSHEQRDSPDNEEFWVHVTKKEKQAMKTKIQPTYNPNTRRITRRLHG